MDFAALSGLDSRRIGIQAHLTCNEDSLQLAATVDAADIALIEANGRRTGTLDLLLVERSFTGAELARTSREITLDLDQPSYQALLRQSLPLTITIEPKQLRTRESTDESAASPPIAITLAPQPGLADLKLVVFDRNSGQVGSLTVPIEP